MYSVLGKGPTYNEHLLVSVLRKPVDETYAARVSATQIIPQLGQLQRLVVSALLNHLFQPTGGCSKRRAL